MDKPLRPLAILLFGAAFLLAVVGGALSFGPAPITAIPVLVVAGMFLARGYLAQWGRPSGR